MRSLSDSIPPKLVEHSEKMIRRSQTKVIFPILTYALVRAYLKTNQRVFSDEEIRRAYEKAIDEIKKFLGHDLHIGGMYYDAYPSRNLPKYEVLEVLGNKRYKLTNLYVKNAKALENWIPCRLKDFIKEKIGVVSELGDREKRNRISDDKNKYLEIIKEHIDKNPTNFEIFCFAVIKVHLEKFACKVYRDTRTSAHDSGVDLSTNFGVVYQIKKMKIMTKDTADEVYAELKSNFDKDRLNDGNVILVIDDVSKEIKRYLIDMKIQSISKTDLIKMAGQFDDMEDREKALRIIYEEFRREYASVI